MVRVLGRKDALHDWIYARCREVEANPDDHLDIWAREHYKSTIITFAGGIQEIVRDQEITAAIFSHTKGIAEKFLGQIKLELEINEILKWAFPDILYAHPQSQSPRWSAKNGLVVKRHGNPREGTLEAWGLVDGMPTSAHFRLMIYDDVVTDTSVTTADQINKTSEAVSLSSALSTEGGRKWWVGTRYHFADTYSVLVERKAVTLRLHPATHDGTKEGRPVLFSQAEWDKRKVSMLDADLACQMLGNPLSGKQRMFNVNDIQVYEVRPRTLMGYLLVDPARSKKKDSANTAMAVIGIDMAGNKYLLDGVDHKMDLMERWRWFRDLRDKWVQAPGLVGLVCGYEETGAQADFDYFHERMRVEGNWFDIVELGWPNEGDGSKRDRIQRLVPDIKGHRFYVPYPTDDEELTRVQRSMIAAGYDYRVARPILRLDENEKIYDVTERLRFIVDLFPFGGRVDLLDAVARIYDADPTPPEGHDNRAIEPEIV